MKKRICELKSGDKIQDAQGIPMIVKGITRANTRFSITTNYVDPGFYRCKDTTRVKSGKSFVLMAK